jgi:hypothetical protein
VPVSGVRARSASAPSRALRHGCERLGVDRRDFSDGRGPSASAEDGETSASPGESSTLRVDPPRCRASSHSGVCSSVGETLPLLPQARASLPDTAARLAPGGVTVAMADSLAFPPGRRIPHSSDRAGGDDAECKNDRER